MCAAASRVRDGPVGPVVGSVTGSEATGLRLLFGGRALRIVASLEDRVESVPEQLLNDHDVQRQEEPDADELEHRGERGAILARPAKDEDTDDAERQRQRRTALIATMMSDSNDPGRTV